MRAKLLARALISGGLLALAVTSIALAHTSLKIGPYTVEVRWVDEPPTVSQPGAKCGEHSEYDGADRTGSGHHRCFVRRPCAVARPQVLV
jgi:hypothetical protein